MTDRVFVDTNIYIYAAIESNDTKHRVASDLLSRLSQTASIIASTQVIGEFYTAMSKNKCSAAGMLFLPRKLARI
jgi:predicted nucleic acid-binding protein